MEVTLKELSTLGDSTLVGVVDGIKTVILGYDGEGNEITEDRDNIVYGRYVPTTKWNGSDAEIDEVCYSISSYMDALSKATPIESAPIESPKSVTVDNELLKAKLEALNEANNASEGE